MPPFSLILENLVHVNGQRSGRTKTLLPPPILPTLRQVLSPPGPSFQTTAAPPDTRCAIDQVSSPCLALPPKGKLWEGHKGVCPANSSCARYGQRHENDKVLFPRQLAFQSIQTGQYISSHERSQEESENTGRGSFSWTLGKPCLAFPRGALGRCGEEWAQWRRC